ncbi:MAG TPA: sigma-54 dependent transcriptional regulator [Polyangia bacterium]|nr:sigma-54 dependent transcriptional regulator [Polyangia bacterium]
MASARILVVGDEINASSASVEWLRNQGYSVETAADGFKALDRVADFAPDLVLADVNMPGMDGLQLLRKLRHGDPELPVIVLTAFGDVDLAIRAIRAGARDYLSKPVSVDELSVLVARELEHRFLRTEMQLLRRRLSDRFSISNIIGSSQSMQAVFKAVAQVAPSRASALISGELGTGKELMATAIHERSPRAKGPFIKLHCASLSECALESALFGHERGAFDGAQSRTDGCFSQAHKGTLFLDEIGEIPTGVQLKLLRFMQEREFERVGSNETMTVDVRLLTATHRDLQKMVACGRFREDLYYRLNVMTINLPPLRARDADVPLLASFFLRKHTADTGKDIRRFSAEALGLLCGYSWPGNVRELENVIERAVVSAESAEITAADLPPQLVAANATSRLQIPGSTLEEIERYAITKTLEATGGSASRAAEILNISVRKIQNKLYEYAEARPTEVGQTE